MDVCFYALCVVCIFGIEPGELWWTSTQENVKHPRACTTTPTSSLQRFGTSTLKQSGFFFSNLAGWGGTLSCHSSPRSNQLLLTPACNTSSELWHFPTGGGKKIEPQSWRPDINHLSNYNCCKSSGCKKEREREVGRGKIVYGMSEEAGEKEKKGGGGWGLARWCASMQGVALVV